MIPPVYTHSTKYGFIEVLHKFADYQHTNSVHNLIMASSLACPPSSLTFCSIKVSLMRIRCDDTCTLRSECVVAMVTKITLHGKSFGTYGMQLPRPGVEGVGTAVVRLSE